MTNVAVILSGCGVNDGTEICEAVLTLLALSSQGVDYQCLAPNIAQSDVINHLTGEVDEHDKRNVLVESARICRGEIADIAKVSVDKYDAVILPGGFGAAKNLSDFAMKGANCKINPTVEAFARDAHAKGLPIGFMCIAPVMIPLLIGKDVKLTIGDDKAVSSEIAKMGASNTICDVTDCIIDEQYKIVSTPAYMSAKNVHEASIGIKKFVDAVIAMT